MQRKRRLNNEISLTAVLLSRLFHPFPVSVLVLFGVQVLRDVPFAASVAWTALSFAIVILPTLSFIIYRIRRGRYEDADISVREDRSLLYGLSGSCFVLLIVLLMMLEAPAIVQRTLQAGLLAMVVGAVFNRFLNKLSLHTLTLAGCAAILLFVSPSIGIALGLISLLVGWSRLYLARHTLPEVLWGWVVGVGVVTIWFSLLRLRDGFVPTCGYHPR